MNRETGSTAAELEATLRDRFAPLHLVVEDDSRRHAGHAGARAGGGHFNVTLVSARFDGRSLLEQHRMVNEALRHLLGGRVHALGLRTIPAADWNQGEETA